MTNRQIVLDRLPGGERLAPEHFALRQGERLGGLERRRAILRIGDRRLERVQIHGHEVEPLDLVFQQLTQVLGRIGPGEEAGMHGGMQRLDTTIENLGETGHGIH